MDIRLQILEGNLTLPAKDLFVSNFGTTEADNASAMFQAAWRNFLLNKGSINLTFWAEQFKNVTAFNSILKVISDNGWFETHALSTRNWAEASLREDKLLEFVTPEELSHVRATKKFLKYMPELLTSKVSSLTKQNGKVRNTGLTRYGLAASAATPFSYDQHYLNLYREAITLNTTKGMQKVRAMFPEMTSDEASYDTVSAAIVDALATKPELYSMGNNFSDSRGRAIKQGLSKVANPIGYKDFRALLVIPEEYRNEATSQGATAIYLFIAELLGFKDGSVLDKELFGLNCYNEYKLHELDLNDEDDRSELYENIWLERLYDDLEAYHLALQNGTTHKWSTPLELDASALT